MTRLLVAALVAVAAAGLALVLRRRRQTDVPTQPAFAAPVQLDRDDFDLPATPWLVAVFSSASCHTCADVVAKASVLASGDVAVADVEFTAARHLHAKYRIDGVPIVVVADSAGVVRRSFVGPVTATDLWAAVAEVRGGPPVC